MRSGHDDGYCPIIFPTEKLFDDLWLAHGFKIAGLQPAGLSSISHRGALGCLVPDCMYILSGPARKQDSSHELYNV